jgi:archaellum component FlaC
VQLFGTKAEKSDYSNRVNRIDEGKFSLIATPSVVAQKLLELTNIEASNLFQKPYTLEDVKQAINEMIQVRSDLTEEIRNFITEDETDVTV